MPENMTPELWNTLTAGMAGRLHPSRALEPAVMEELEVATHALLTFTPEFPDPGIYDQFVDQLPRYGEVMPSRGSQKYQRHADVIHEAMDLEEITRLEAMAEFQELYNRAAGVYRSTVAQYEQHAEDALQTLQEARMNAYDPLFQGNGYAEAEQRLQRQLHATDRYLQDHMTRINHGLTRAQYFGQAEAQGQQLEILDRLHANQLPESLQNSRGWNQTLREQNLADLVTAWGQEPAGDYMYDTAEYNRAYDDINRAVYEAPRELAAPPAPAPDPMETVD